MFSVDPEGLLFGAAGGRNLVDAGAGLVERGGRGKGKNKAATTGSRRQFFCQGSNDLSDFTGFHRMYGFKRATGFGFSRVRGFQGSLDVGFWMFGCGFRWIVGCWSLG